LIGNLANNRRNRCFPSLLGSQPPPLSRNELVTASRNSPNSNRLQDSRGLDRIRQLPKRPLVHMCPGLVGIAVDQLDRKLVDGIAVRGGRTLRRGWDGTGG